jgi:hypothetical protein
LIGSITNELNKCRAQSSHLLSQQSNNGVTQSEENENRRKEVEHAYHLMKAKDHELKLLRDQQDRTMKLLYTCTQQRDLLVNDNRLLRDELDNLYKRWNNGGNNEGNNGGNGIIGGNGDIGRVMTNGSKSEITPTSLLNAFGNNHQTSPALDKNKIFVSANRRSSRVISSESRHQVINARTSAKKNNSIISSYNSRTY